MADLTEQQKARVVAYKAFDKEMQCRGFQYAVGQEYEHDGVVAACKSGFHACEYPLDMFRYYDPGSGARFCAVEQDGTLSRNGDDTKVASSRITINAEIGIPGIIKAAIEYVKIRCEPAKEQHATGYSSASSATGYRSASSATGDRSASLTTGAYSTSQITPNSEGNPLNAVAIATGYESKARAPSGSAIVLVNRDDYGNIRHIRASKIGMDGVKPDVWYSLNADGEFEEAQS